MKMSASRIRHINRCLSHCSGSSFYNENRVPTPQVPNTTYTHIVFVPAPRS